MEILSSIKRKYKHIKRLIKRAISLGAFEMVHLFYHLYPIKQNRVMFLSDVRKVLGGNLKCIYYALPDSFEKVICFKGDRREKEPVKEKIRRAKILTTSKYILLDDFSTITSYMHVRKGQELVQLWHGAGAFKKFGHSRSIKNGGDVARIHPGYKRYTKAIVSSEAIRKNYAEAFDISIDKVKATGFPRTDCFFDKKYIEDKKKEFYDEYPELKNKKIILFAPTYRNVRVNDASYDFDKLDLDKIYNELKDDYVFIFKWHPALYNNIKLGKVETYNYDLEKYNGFYLDMSENRDINDLLLVTSVLITDYSSVIFDYEFLHKPVIYFAYDFEDYNNQRGLYYDFNQYVYGPVVVDTTSLIEKIKTEDLMEDKRKVFRKQFLSACDGKSTKKTVRWIFNIK